MSDAKVFVQMLRHFSSAKHVLENSKIAIVNLYLNSFLTVCSKFFNHFDIRIASEFLKGKKN